jgi:tetratricopeptide (TPR) repeat protein
MKTSFFAKIDLPSCREKAFEDFLLGTAEHAAVVSGDSHEEKPRRGNVQDWLNVAHDHYFRGNFLDGITGYARVLQADQSQVSAWVGQVRILVDVGRYDSAIYWADRGLALLEDTRLLAFAKAYALAYAGKVEDAKVIINIPVEKSESPMLWLLRGEVFLRIKISFIQKLFTPHKNIGRLGAFFCFLKALSSDQRDPFINQRVGLAYMMAGDHRRAFEHLKVSFNEVCDNPLTLYGLAECYRTNRDYERALYYVKKAIAGNPNLDSAFALLRRLHSPYRIFRKFKRKKGKESL